MAHVLGLTWVELQTKKPLGKLRADNSRAKFFKYKSFCVSGWDGHLRAKARHDCYVEECLLCGWHPYSTENGKHVF